MTKEQFQEIKNSAWAWYRGNMLEWSIKTIKDIKNAPQWVKDCLASDMIVCPSMDDEVFELAHKEDVETILQVSQRRHFELNYIKEMHEYFEARLDSNEYEMVDALCDMIITAMNAGGDLGKEFGSYGALLGGTFNITSVLNDHSEIYKLCDSIRYLGYDPYRCLTETIKELETRTGAWNEAEGKWCKDLGAYTEQEAYEIAKEKGIFYNFGLEYDKKTKEPYWVSDTNYSADWKKLKIKKWYKADYTKCKMDKQ